MEPRIEYIKYNLINTNGELLSPYQWFDFVDAFYDGYAVVALSNKGNFINTNGEFLWNKPLNQWFDEVYNFKNGYAIVKLSVPKLTDTLNYIKKCNFINTNGEFLWNKPVDQWFDYILVFSEGYALVELNGEWYKLRSDGVLCDKDTKEPLKDL